MSPRHIIEKLCKPEATCFRHQKNKEKKRKENKQTTTTKKLTQDTVSSEKIFQEGSDNQRFLR